MLSPAKVLVILALLLGLAMAQVEKIAPITNHYSFSNAEDAKNWGVELSFLEEACKSTDLELKNLATAKVDDMFASYASKQGKQYSASETIQRKRAFTNNLWSLSTTNLKAPSAGWWGALNEFSDLSWDEFAATRLMREAPKLEKKVPKQLKARKALPIKPIVVGPIILGESVNWAAADRVTSVKDQGGCGSCWAFAAVASLEARKLISAGTSAAAAGAPDLSEQQLVDCVTSPRTDTAGNAYNSGGCSGGWSQEAFDYIYKFNLTTETNYPYTATEGICHQRVLEADSGQLVMKQSGASPGWSRVPTNSVTALKAAVRSSPPAFYMRVEAGFHAYSGGIYSTACVNSTINHAMLLTGYYIPIMGTPHWRIKNSWGTSWGESGYMRARMDTSAGGANAGLCSMHTYAYYPNANPYWRNL